MCYIYHTKIKKLYWGSTFIALQINNTKVTLGLRFGVVLESMKVMAKGVYELLPLPPTHTLMGLIHSNLWQFSNIELINNGCTYIRAHEPCHKQIQPHSANMSFLPLLDKCFIVSTYSMCVSEWEKLVDGVIGFFHHIKTIHTTTGQKKEGNYLRWKITTFQLGVLWWLSPPQLYHEVRYTLHHEQDYEHDPSNKEMATLPPMELLLLLVTCLGPCMLRQRGHLYVVHLAQGNCN